MAAPAETITPSRAPFDTMFAPLILTADYALNLFRALLAAAVEPPFHHRVESAHKKLYVIAWRKMERKAPIHVSGKTVLTIAVGVAGALALGVGMCFCMVWDKLVVGVIIGLMGIVALLCLIPLTKGIKE